MVGLLKLAVLRESRDPRLVKVGAVAVGDVAIAWVIQRYTKTYVNLFYMRFGCLFHINIYLHKVRRVVVWLHVAAAPSKCKWMPYKVWFSSRTKLDRLAEVLWHIFF